MIGWALTFLVIAIIAAIFGFGGIAGSAAWIAQMLSGVFLLLFVFSLIRFLVRSENVEPGTDSASEAEETECGDGNCDDKEDQQK